MRRVVAARKGRVESVRREADGVRLTVGKPPTGTEEASHGGRNLHPQETDR